MCLIAWIIYQLDWYAPSRKLFWSYTLTFDTFLFLLSPLTLFSLFITYPNDKIREVRIFVTLFSLIILACLIPYKQVFPYYMQVMIPVFLMLYASFFTWVFEITKQYHLSSWMISSLIIMLGILYPLTLTLRKAINLDNAYQKANINILDQLLKDGSDYVAGMDLIYTRDQPIRGMRLLIGPQIDYLYEASSKLKPIMLASLDLDSNVSWQNIITSLHQSQVKYYVNNYRMEALPPPIKDYLHEQYDHLWGSIYVYAPLVHPGKQTISIRFEGEYQMISDNPSQHKTLFLKKGSYTFVTKSAYRLKYHSFPHDIYFNPRFEKDQWMKIVS